MVIIQPKAYLYRWILSYTAGSNSFTDNPSNGLTTSNKMGKIR